MTSPPKRSASVTSGDITYLPIGERGFLYLATAIDLHSRRLAGWAIADHMRTDLGHRRPRRRAEYTSRSFADACTRAGVRQPMSKVGSSADNALAESFNATFKREALQGRRAFTDEREAGLASVRWLHRYNTVTRRASWPVRATASA